MSLLAVAAPRAFAELLQLRVIHLQVAHGLNSVAHIEEYLLGFTQAIFATGRRSFPPPMTPLIVGAVRLQPGHRKLAHMIMIVALASHHGKGLPQFDGNVQSPNVFPLRSEPAPISLSLSTPTAKFSRAAVSLSIKIKEPNL
ncbi:hypothetical protein K438DRAFT_1767634 [Mycena galopus ATCC 62051]|nr:hypothetical protein K438DRAFT_1767634 [Mycena galopus ATCC 62051]